jgi:putative oxidoreductase
MIGVKATVAKWYRAKIQVPEHVQNVFLLILRLYFGWGFINAGTGKLLNVETHTVFFRDWGIPAPMLNVYLAGTTETVCGFLLLIGLASRIITIPLIVTMLVAYLTAHTDQLRALWNNTPLFFKAPPFPYLFTSLDVFLFGPGLFSVDGLIHTLLARRNPGARQAGVDEAISCRTSSSQSAAVGSAKTTLSSRGKP